MRVRKSASSVVAIGALLSAVLLWGGLPNVALSQSETPSAAASSLEPISTEPPLATEAVPEPCVTTPIPTEAVPTEAVPTEAVPTEAATSGATPIETLGIPVEGSGEPCESAAPSESAAPTEPAAPSESAAATEPAAPSESAAASEAPAASESASAFCALLTTDEIQGVIGSPVIAGSGDDTSCGWASADPSKATLIVVQDLAVSDFDQLKSMTVPGVVTTHVNVGDDAFAQSLNDTVTTLYMKKGDRAIEVLVVDSSLAGNDLLTLEYKLAQIIAGRI
jgi:hypothetical protein